jgi:radical SAM protein with 4Fe4S-binding SPASM domain
MANLLVTTDCQRKCPYCFAQGDKDKRLTINWDDFITVTNFIATGPRALNLLGGEPTLHPDFDHMLSYLLEKDYIVQVFTNGMVRGALLDKITDILNRIALRDHQLFFAVNINEEKYRSKEEDRLQKRFLNSMGHLAYPSFTIHEKTSLLFLQKTVEDYYLEKSIRLGLAMPIQGVNNKFLPKESYRDIAQSIVELANNSEGTTITFDCGFPLCMFELDEISELTKNEENDFSFICGTPLDIYPDLTMTNCYPLSKLHKTHIMNFNNIMDAYKYFEEGFAVPEGIYGQKCVECQFFRKVCYGGCKGFAVPEEKQ